MSGARVVTDEMFLAAAETLAEAVADENIRQGTVYPPLSSIREISVAIAVAVAEIAHSTGLARFERPSDGLVAHIKSQMFDPTY